MSDPHRLAELERQRAIIAAHLQWLDDQIARERQGSASPESPAAQPIPIAASAELARMRGFSRSGGHVTEFPARPDDIGVVPLQDSDPLPSKSGCWIAFTTMLVGLVTAVGLFIYFRYGRGL